MYKNILAALALMGSLAQAQSDGYGDMDMMGAYSLLEAEHC